MKKQRKVIDVKIPEHRRRKPNLNTGKCTKFGQALRFDPFPPIFQSKVVKSFESKPKRC